MARNRWTSDLHRKVQLRSEDTQTKLLNAAETLIDRNGSDAISVTDIASNAGVSIGSLYHQFTDKSGLLDAVFTRVLDEMETTCKAAVLPERWQGASVRDILEGIVSFSIESAPGGNVKATKLIIISSDQDFRSRYFNILRELFEGFQKLLLERRNEIHHPRPKEAIGFVLDQMSMLILGRLDPTCRASLLVSSKDRPFSKNTVASAEAYLQLH